MGLGRGVAKVLGGIIFSVCLSLAVINMSLVQLTDYGTIKPLLMTALKPQVVERVQAATAEGVTANQIVFLLVLRCEGKDVLTETLPLEYSGLPMVVNASLDCNRIRDMSNENDTASTIDYIADSTASSVIDSIYYFPYDCEPLDCISKGRQQALVSKQGNTYLRGIQTPLIAASIIGAILILFASESWSERMKGIGIAMLLLGLSYYILLWGGGYLESLVPPDVAVKMQSMGLGFDYLLRRLIDPMEGMFGILLLSGAILTAGGFVVAHYESKGKPRADFQRKPSKGSFVGDGTESGKLTTLGPDARNG
jgi:hypothetical protein